MAHRLMLFGAAAAAVVLLALQTVAQPADGLDRLTPQARVFVARNAGNVYRMPDGKVWDGTQAARCRADYDKYAVRRTPVTTRPGGGLLTKVKGKPYTAFESESRAAKMWRFSSEPPLSNTSDRRPTLWTSAGDDDPPFIFIDANKVDEVTRYGAPNGQYTKIQMNNGMGEAEVVVRPFTGPSNVYGRTVTVRLPEPDARGNAVVEEDALAGEFFLWPIELDRPPEPGALPSPSRGTVYRYIPASALRITPRELAEAALAGELELAEWHWKQTRGGGVWERRVIPAARRAP